jgi:hypothetical protein
LSACAISPEDAVRDLAAIHTETDWQPRSPAQMSVPPAWYLEGVKSAKVPQAGSYEVSDHRALELAILDEIGPIDVQNPAMAFESAAWLMLELLHDDHGTARVLAAVHLSNLAGAWIADKGARLPAEPLHGDLAAALHAVEAAQDAKQFLAALELVQQAPLADGTSLIRLTAGLGRRASLHQIGPGHESAALMAAIGTRAVIAALTLGAADADQEVARACRERQELLSRYASQR